MVADRSASLPLPRDAGRAGGAHISPIQWQATRTVTPRLVKEGASACRGR